MKKVIVLCGPTASGKSDLAIKVANHFKGSSIINADSVSIYSNLNIGAAKPDREQLRQAQHLLFDICEFPTRYTIFDYQQDARRVIEESEVPILVGGSGLYIKAAIDNYELPAEDEIYEKFIEECLEKTNEEIFDKLIQVNSEIITKTHINNRQRNIRYLYNSLNKRLSIKKSTNYYDYIIVYLDIPKEILKQRLKVRLDKQLNDGFIKEVEELIAKQVFPNQVGYKELVNFLRNKNTMMLNDIKDEIIKNSLRLAKKQKTWFKNQFNCISLDALDSKLIDKMIEIVEEFLEES